jgi:hypothetical protein
MSSKEPVPRRGLVGGGSVGRGCVAYGDVSIVNVCFSTGSEFLVRSPNADNYDEEARHTEGCLRR